MMSFKLRLGLIPTIILGLGFSVLAQTISRANPTKGTGVPVRYVIIWDKLEDVGTPRLTSRHVEVLLDEKTFSEETLRSLFGLLSKRFPEPASLFVNVYTSLEQAPTPEERDLGGRSNVADEPKGQYLWAIYIRSRDDEYFRYSPVGDKLGNLLVQISKLTD